MVDPHALQTPDPGDKLARLDTYIQGWLAQVGSRSPATADTYRDALHRSGPSVLNARPGALTPHVAAQLYQQWLKEWEVSTANITVAAWTTLFDDLIAQGVLPGPNPWTTFKRRRVPERIAGRVLTEDEVKRLFVHAAPGLDRLLFRFLYYTGVRISEACALTWSDIHRGPDGVMVATVLGKGSKTRYVRIRPALWTALQALSGSPDDRIFPISRQRAWNHLHAAAVRAGLTTQGRSISPHVLRHSHATHAIEHGANIMAVKENLGHARLDTTQIYVNLQPGPRSEDYLTDF